MQALPALKYEVMQQVYDPINSHIDETNFYHQRQGSPSELTKQLTYILGDYTKKFPLSTMTLGGVGYNESAFKSSAVELADPQFTYPVMGNIDKASVVAKNDYAAGDKAGINYTEFSLYFRDNWIKRFYVIQSSRGTQAYVLEDPIRQADGLWKYKCVLTGAAEDDYVPDADVAIGSAWIGLWTAVPESQSRSSTTNMVTPGLFKNQMGFQRLGMSWAGSVRDRVMKFKIKTDKGETEMWMDWFMYQFELEWLSMAEHAYWYSRYNRRADGTVPLKDLVTGKVIMQGSGVLEQIVNKSTYSSLTYNYLQQYIGDALYGLNDTDNMVITLWGGKGAVREIDRALRAEGARIVTDFSAIADKFITGSGRELMLGGFFKGFYHIDGYTIVVKENPIYDHGKVAKAQIAGGYVHPETGFPMESYRLTGIDVSDSDGQPNLRHVVQKDRAFLHGVIPGLSKPPRSIEVMSGYSNVDGAGKAGLIVNEVDEGGYTRFRSCGVQLMRGNRSFDLQCTAAD